MAPRRRELPTDEDPWRVSAFTSALLELLLSLLLLLGAAIAFITLQLVKYFGLDPPCTYIGCSHPLLPHTSSKWRRYSSRFRHRRAKVDYLSERLFPDRRKTRRYRKLQPKNEEFFTIDDDTDESILSEKSDTDLQHSAAATSDSEVRQGNFDESCIRSYSNQNANRVRSACSWPIYKKPTKTKYVKLKASVFCRDGKQCTKEERIPLFPTRTASAHSDNLDVDEDSSPSSERPSFQKEKLQREILADNDASISRDSKHGYHLYKLLVEKDPSQRKCVKTNTAFFGSYGLQFAREELVPLYSPRSVSAGGSIFYVEDGCRMSSTSTDDLEKPSFQNEKVQRGTLRDVEALTSMKSGHECNQLKSVRANCVRNGIQSANEEYVQFLRRACGSDSDAEDDDSEMSFTSTDGFKKPSLQKEMPEGVDGNESISSDIEHAHHYMLLEDEDEELCKPPCFDCKEDLARNFEYEHYDLLSDGKDEEVVKASFFSNLPKDGTQPLLECISDSRSESPKNSTSDLGNNIAKMVPDSSSELLSNIARAAESYAQGEWIKGSTAIPCNLSSGLGEGRCMVPLFTVSATSESIVKEERCVIQEKIQVNTDFSADEGNLESVQGFENANPGNFDGIMVEDQVGEDGIPNGEALKEPLEVLLNVQILEKEDVDVEEGASNPYIASDLQGLCECVSSNRSMEDNCSILDICVQETQGKGHEETMLKASLDVSIQETLDLCLTSFDGCGSEGKCANSSDSIDVHVGQAELTTKGNILEAFEKPCHYGDSETLEVDSKSEQGELVPNDSCKGSQKNTAINGSCAEEVKIIQSLGIRNAKSRTSSEQMILHSQVMKAEVIKEDTSMKEDEEEGLDALKEALRVERITLATLETELENERNAAAIATNEAMAMIARLQEEKSAMQMEVKQLQRMSEEKADYDEQAMELLKEILLKREKEKHALEKEVELYRERLLAEKGDMFKKSSVEKSNKCVSKPALTPMLLLRGIDEDNDFLSPEGKNDRLKTLPSLEAFYDAGITRSPHIAGQSMACREELGSTSLPVELKDTELSRVNQVDTCFQEDGGNPAESFTNEIHSNDQEPRGTSRSFFSTNDEETQFILERLWVLEEELRELRREDGLGPPSEALHGDEEGRIMRKSDGSCANSGGASRCINGLLGEQINEGAAGMPLPIHDVYEVQPTPYYPGEGAQHGDTLEYSEKTLKDFEGFPRDISQAYMAASSHEYSTHNISQARILLPSKEAQGGSALALNQDYVYANDTKKLWLETAEGTLVATDNVQQLAVRLQVLETDRELLRETLESSRQRDAELRLLQEIARNLRGLQMVGRAELFSADGVLIEDISQQDRDDKAGSAAPAFGQSCASVLKKRRYCNGPGQAQTLLLQQRSI